MWPLPWCMSSAPNHCLVRSVMLEEEGAAVRTTAVGRGGAERAFDLVLSLRCCVYASNPRDEAEFSEDPKLEPPSPLLLRHYCDPLPPPPPKKKKRNADSVYVGGSDTSQSFIVPIMSWWAALLTHKLSALLRVYRQPGSAVGSCGLSKSGMRLPESCQSASLAAKGRQWTKQPDWWIN